MSEKEINLNDPENEFLIYLSNKIGKRNDLTSTSAKVYAQAMISKIMNEYQVDDSKLIGVVGNRESMEYILTTFLDGYMNYFVANDINFDHLLLPE